MGVTNLRYGSELCSRARGNAGLDQVAVIADLNKAVHLDCRSVSTQELGTYSRLFSIPTYDQQCWLKSPKYSVTTIEIPEPARVPEAVLTPGVGDFWRPSSRRTGDPPVTEPTNLAYIAIIHGLSGAAVLKVIVRYSQKAIGSAMFHELMNGYSIVFSGAFLKANIEKAARNRDLLWQKVEAYEQLLELQKVGEEKDKDGVGALGGEYTVGIVC